MKPEVALIGAQGRIGAAAGTALIKRGHHVVGLARDPDRPNRRTTPFPVRPLRLTDPAQLAADLDDVEVVIYCAGAYHEAVETIHELAVFEINAIAALRTALAAAYVNARRFVYLSSTAVMGRDTDGCAGAYVRSKRLAEQVLTDTVPIEVTILRLGWVIDPEDEVAYRKLWPPSGRQVIVGDQPVPIVALSDVANAATLLASRDLYGHADLSGCVDLVVGCPTQEQLYELASSLAITPIRVVDAGTVARVARLAALRRNMTEAPTWLTQSTPLRKTSWTSFGLTLTSWQDCVRNLWRAQTVHS
ncbi:MAG: NAD(P)-dependent oxidoreductase [Pseudonocardiales bacterium]|nr:NAD(P)-dependent oxidoreductase [Pseudonocardiales bacterium]